MVLLLVRRSLLNMAVLNVIKSLLASLVLAVVFIIGGIVFCAILALLDIMSNKS